MEQALAIVIILDGMDAKIAQLPVPILGSLLLKKKSKLYI